MNNDIQTYHLALPEEEQAICNLLYTEICRQLPEAEHKLWHAHPVWFLDGNPVAGYSKSKSGGIRLLFWSGQSFNEDLLLHEGKFKAAEIHYTQASQVNKTDLTRWLSKCREIQWDYKNLVKRKGVLERLK